MNTNNEVRPPFSLFTPEIAKAAEVDIQCVISSN